MKLIVFKIIIILKIESIMSADSYRTKFNSVCGQPQLTGRIIGGTDASLGEFPWHARLGIKRNFFEKPNFYCGGTLFTDRHILTADHCFNGLDRHRIAPKVVVRLGDHNSNGLRSCVNGRCSKPPITYNVQKLIVHTIDETNFKNDLAILQLSNKVEFTRWISPICLPDNISPTTLVHEKVIVIGFGLVNSVKREVATVLQKITISIKPLKSCYIFEETPGPGQLCAGSANKDSCGGDSGGPLLKLVNGKNGPRYIQLGIVSHGAEHCEDKSPAVYTDVNYYLQWIDDHLGH